MDSPSASSATLSIHSDDMTDTDKLIHHDPPGVFDGPIDFAEYAQFNIPEEYLEAVQENSLSPSMRAASNADCRILKALLQKGFFYFIKYPDRNSHSDNEYPHHHESDHRLAHPSEFGFSALRSNGRNEIGITTPLMEALRARLPENVRTLLIAGANPDGVPIHILEAHAALFLRFRPSIHPLEYGSKDAATRSEYLRLMDISQISSLTKEEVDDRRWDGLAPFWCEERFTPSSFWKHGASMHSLVEAAGLGDVEDFNLLLEYGADASFWMTPHLFVPEPPSSSSLCISTPIHAAIEHGKHSMLRHILDLGFDPNTMALANPTRCVTPLMATLLHHDRFDKESFDMLSMQPNINFEIRTPIYGVHLLHFAVAKLNFTMLRHVVSFVPLRNAGTTAIGHTLLHVACMPSRNVQIQRRSDIIMRSIHETRDTRAENDINAVPAVDSNALPHPIDLYTQSSIMKYLWNNGVQDIDSKDVHGNTALHYLAGCRAVNHLLFEWFLKIEDVEDVWYHSENDQMATPADLLDANERVSSNSSRSYPITTLDRQWSASRAARKEEIWDELLDGLR
ncbi:Ankyrin repeat-containing protein [Glarea lozoyensis ATCC 20868]|uniref:Ankyrin repeat-containing protein n=1 Tax=Glarea lozoyensis (strain ATCC 20868 / MF5171) TaxID=1116229 RepID=S3DDU5_GLAL2|nr:Ankyrin repeat-containing protein [Glarea lozoyensis ATCC 20868]EPE30161.1 Ankyrin repeat-containing protein [Glarea lozoyensis ATCC 20868]